MDRGFWAVNKKALLPQFLQSCSRDLLAAKRSFTCYVIKLTNVFPLSKVDLNKETSLEVFKSKGCTKSRYVMIVKWVVKSNLVAGT